MTMIDAKPGGRPADCTAAALARQQCVVIFQGHPVATSASSSPKFGVRLPSTPQTLVDSCLVGCAIPAAIFNFSSSKFRVFCIPLPCLFAFGIHSASPQRFVSRARAQDASGDCPESKPRPPGRGFMCDQLPMARRSREPVEPVTLDHIRGHGCRDLLVYCVSGWCHHSATLNADWLPDETAIRALCPRMVCMACGLIGADVRPDWSPHMNVRNFWRHSIHLPRSFIASVRPKRVAGDRIPHRRSKPGNEVGSYL